MWFNSRPGRQPGRAHGATKITEEISNEAHRLMNQLEEMQRRIYEGMMEKTEIKNQEAKSSRVQENEEGGKAANDGPSEDEIDLITLRRRKGSVEEEPIASSEPISTEPTVEKELEVNHDVIELPGPVKDATPAIESDTCSTVTESQQTILGHYRDASRVQELANSIPEHIEPVVVKPKPVSPHGMETVHISKDDFDIDHLDSSQIRARYAKNSEIEKEPEQVQPPEPEKWEVQVNGSESMQAEAETSPSIPVQENEQATSSEPPLNENLTVEAQAEPEINPSEPSYSSASNEQPLPEPETQPSQNEPPTTQSKVTPTSGKHLATEYIVLTREQKMIETPQLPLSPDEIVEYSFPVLSSLKNPSKYAKSITKLEKQGWRIIGGGGDLIVFERMYDRRRRARKTQVRRGLTVAGTVGLLGASIMALNERPSTEVKPRY